MRETGRLSGSVDHLNKEMNMYHDMHRRELPAWAIPDTHITVCSRRASSIVKALAINEPTNKLVAETNKVKYHNGTPCIVYVYSIDGHTYGRFLAKPKAVYAIEHKLSQMNWRIKRLEDQCHDYFEKEGKMFDRGIARIGVLEEFKESLENMLKESWS